MSTNPQDAAPHNAEFEEATRFLGSMTREEIIALYNGLVRSQRQLEKNMDKPVRFSGRGPTTARAWYDLVAEYFDLIGLPKHHRVSRVAFHLEGRALAHQRDYVASLDPPPREEVGPTGTRTKVIDWEPYAASAIAFLDPQNDEQEAADKLLKLEQTRDVRRYVNEFDDLKSRLSDELRKNEPYLLQQFTHGLSDVIRSEVRARAPKNLLEAKQLAVTFADRRSGHAGRSSHYRDSGRRYHRPEPMDVDAVSVSQSDYGSTDDSDGTDCEAKVMAVFAEARNKRLARRNAPRISDEEYRRRREDRLCFACGGSNHSARSCPKYPPPGKDRRRR